MRILVLAILVGLVAVTMARSKPSLNKVLRAQKKARRLSAASNSDSSEESSEVGLSDYYADRLSQNRRLAGGRSRGLSRSSFGTRRLSRFPRRFGDDSDDQFNNVAPFRSRNLVGGFPSSDFNRLPHGLNRNVFQQQPRRLYNNNQNYGLRSPTRSLQDGLRNFPRHLQFQPSHPMIPRI